MTTECYRKAHYEVLTKHKKRSPQMPEWDITITRRLTYRVEGEKDAAKAKALEKAVSGEEPDDSSIEHEVFDQVEVA